MSARISPETLRERLHSGRELALVDVREAGPFSLGHPLFAVPCPYSRFEARIGALVPRTSAPVVLVDEGDGVADRAAANLAVLGYSDVSVLEGGATAWAAAGNTLYQGVNVPSKVLGELAEATWHPRTIDAETLAAWRAKGRPFRLFDCRPASEFARMTIPGAVCMPNGELAHRLATADAADLPIVLTCAGRTRGLMGAVGLAMVAPGHEVHALENGTQGWALAGLDLARGNEAAPLPELDAAAREETAARAEAFASARGIRTLGARRVEELRSEPGRTAYLLDVRSAAEVAADPLPAFVHAPAGQLVQATDQWIGVRRARVVLADDLGLRAALTAYWLGLMGFEPCVAKVDDTLRALTPRPGPRRPRGALKTIGPAAALRDIASGSATLVDLRPSAQFGERHVRGAVWSIRPRLDALQGGRRLILVADDEETADLAAEDLRRLGIEEVLAVEGGIDGLTAAGADLVSTSDDPPLEQALDVTWFAHGRHEGDLDASRLYLAWEQGLVEQLDAAERAEFLL